MKYEMNIKGATLKGEEIGIEKGVIQSIVGMLKAGIDYELIAKATNCPLIGLKTLPNSRTSSSPSLRIQ